ncbi:hypothetical protein SERLA73DRAFT_187452 [Serpula lacrymans var. lacrymans S7.3]|uniref:FUN14 family-domain-containing protein n=2 Tax=Serpula lacrymans var. lacrymans TaxID=341189 RepID=F8Q974_SERL3|nr:uncharacterized protein SERLADRAFT_477043 [Serpula lacrymans var. lacrymans S7.9]EGN95129.1 hypothetical protein SERLA73DRAFT_187452 [Serpula lacrymans var. lacrymans S7.3]EGO20638.1 hypothetical protein SERLADRAFT_477043 [Serpula lacrymans var. lacrymans S7.9]
MASIFTRQFLGIRPALCHQSYFVQPAKGSFNAFRTSLNINTLRVRSITNASIHYTVRNSTRKGYFPSLLAAVGIGGAALGFAGLTASPIYCEAPTQPTSRQNSLPPTFTPPPASNVNLYELSFGTLCGLCAGVFIKKGAKAVAFFLGGVFVLLQYLGSASLVRVDWARMGARFENLFYTKDVTGQKRAPTVYSLWRWLVDFLTADFQPRASFLAGFALGLRIG